jgi:hypothetical protein
MMCTMKGQRGDTLAWEIGREEELSTKSPFRFSDNDPLQRHFERQWELLLPAI